MATSRGGAYRRWSRLTEQDRTRLARISAYAQVPAGDPAHTVHQIDDVLTDNHPPVAGNTPVFKADDSGASDPAMVRETGQIGFQAFDLTTAWFFIRDPRFGVAENTTYTLNFPITAATAPWTGGPYYLAVSENADGLGATLWRGDYYEPATAVYPKDSATRWGNRTYIANKDTLADPDPASPDWDLIADDQALIDHELAADPHPQYLTPSELPTVTVSWFSTDPHPEDPAKYVTYVEPPGGAETTITVPADSTTVPTLVGGWMRYQEFQTSFEWYETRSIVHLDLYVGTARDIEAYVEFWHWVGGLSGTPTLIATSERVNLDIGDREAYSIPISIAGPLDIEAGDHVETRVYVIKDQAGASADVTLYMEGNDVTRTVTYSPIPTYPAPHAETHEPFGTDPLTGYVDKTGDTMTGPLIIESTESSSLRLDSPSDVNATIAFRNSAKTNRGGVRVNTGTGELRLEARDASGTVQGSATLETDGNLSVNGAAPTAAEDLTRKDYVDAADTDIRNDVLATMAFAAYGGLRINALVIPGWDITAAWQTLDVFTNVAFEPPLGITQDLANNGLRFEHAGVYMVSVAGSFEHDSQNAGRITYLRYWNDTEGTASLTSLSIGIGRNSEASAFSALVPVQIDAATVGDLLQFQIGGGDAVTVYDFTALGISAWNIGLWAEPLPSET